MSAEELEKIIENVRSHPELYDTGHKDYKSTKFKEDIWAEIAVECQSENASSVKHLWKKLRDSHRESIKRSKTKSGQGKSNMKKWRFHDQMAFLEKYMIKRDTQSNISEISDDNLFTGESDSIIELNMDENITKPKKKTKEDEIISLIKLNNKRREEQMSIRKEIRQQDTEQANRALHNFFMSMYETTLTFPQHLQREAKISVFNVISELEERQSDDHHLLPPIFQPFSTPERPTSNLKRPRSTSVPYIEEDSNTQGVIVSMSDMVNISMPISSDQSLNEEGSSCSYVFTNLEAQNTVKQKKYFSHDVLKFNN